jgi:hypothetical protein
MDRAHEIAGAARHRVTEHGEAAKTIALARAKHAEDSKRGDVAIRWRDIAAGRWAPTSAGHRAG